jgi:hypothetical protein
LPKAYVVKSDEANAKSEEGVLRSIHRHVQDHKAHYKWLKGGISFIGAIPKSPSDKICDAY